MTFLLDTNACIRFLNGTSLPLVRQMRAHPPADLRLSAVVEAELIASARKSARVEENLDLLRRFFEPLVSIPFDRRCAAEYGVIRSDLERQGAPIGPNDLLIAATARAHDFVLVTHNTGEFSRVPGLRLNDWEKD